MTLSTLSHLNRWWIGKLLNALLRPVWLGSPERGNSLRFLRLVNACDCWPFAVGWDNHQLWISDRPEDVDEMDRRVIAEKVGRSDSAIDAMTTRLRAEGAL